jgi:hypothetical protein
MCFVDCHCSADMELAESDFEAIQKYLQDLLQRSRDVMVSFVDIELQTGFTACRYLRNSQAMTEPKKAWHLNFTKKSLQDAEAAMWKLKMNHPEFDQMMALVERRRFELNTICWGFGICTSGLMFRNGRPISPGINPSVF